MAAIDKTYVNNWKDYCEIVDWCKKNKFTCPNGTVIRFYPYEWEEHHFENGNEYPVLNTSQTQDYFLIKYCPIQVVQNRMKEVYDEDEYMSILNGTSEFDKFVRPPKVDHIKLIKKPYYYEPDKYYSKTYGSWTRDSFEIDVELPDDWTGYAWYNDDSQQWVLPYELGTWNCNKAFPKCKSWKALIRKIRSWYLPKGTIIKVSFFRFTGGECEFIVK